MADLATLYDPLSAPNFLRRRNQPFVRPGVSELDFTTHLDPADEQSFLQWAAQNKVPFDPAATGPQDYDMRGFWQGLMRGDPHATTGIDPNDRRLHFSDWWKTPLHESFSNESRFAGPGAPRWLGDQLVAPNGAVIFDDKQRR